MQNFILMFGVLVGDLVPLEEYVGQFHFLLRQIVDIVLSRRVKEGYGDVEHFYQISSKNTTLSKSKA